MPEEILQLRAENERMREREDRVRSAVTWFKWVVGLSIPLFIFGVGWLISIERNLSSIRTDVNWLIRIVAQEVSGKPIAKAEGGDRAQP